jgi:hypothetical protein
MENVILWILLLSVLGIVLFTFGKERSVKVNLTLMILSLLIAVMGLIFKEGLSRVFSVVVWGWLTCSYYSDYKRTKDYE